MAKWRTMEYRTEERYEELLKNIERERRKNKPRSMRRGGTAKKTGRYRLHRGERVVSRRS